MPSAQAHPMRFLAAGETTPWWYVLAGIGMTFLGAILKTFVDLVSRRDSFDEKFRADLMSQIGSLREWNAKQQLELNTDASRILTLESSIKGEQQLRHDLRGQLVKEQLLHQEAKDELKHTVAECKKLENENVRLSRILETHGISIPPAPHA